MWLCVAGLVLAAICLFTGFVTTGVIGLVGFTFFGWFDWHEFGRPQALPPRAAWYPDDDDDDSGPRLGPRRPRRGPRGGRGGGGSKVPARVRSKPPSSGGSQ